MWKYRLLSALTLLALLVLLESGSCLPQPETEIKFVIPKGEHYSVPRVIRSLDRIDFRFKAMFDSTAIYTPDPEGDLNKLMGFSDCGFNHHENSARFAWRWNDGLEIWAYVYNEKELKYYHLVDIGLNEWYDYVILINANSYTFQVNGFGMEVQRQADCRRGQFQMLFPYFGGQAVAPHDITIKVKF